MNKRYRFALLFFVVAGISLAMLPVHLSAERSDRAKMLGRKLMCMCGCGQILTECNHINCPSSGPMLKELDQHVAAGEADSLVIQDFVQEYGERVLSEPPSTGFNSIAWYIPGAAFALGLGIVVTLIRMWRKRDISRVATASAAPPAAASAAGEMRNIQLERARKQADQETEE